MLARFPGVCHATGRQYAAGAVITKTRLGWALDDATTGRAVTAAATATHVWSGRHGHEVGDVIRRGDDVVTVIAATSVWYSAEDADDMWDCGGAGYRHTTYGRLATDGEAEPLLTREARTRARRAARAHRDAARESLLGMPMVPTVRPSATVTTHDLDDPSMRGHVYSPPTWQALIDDAGAVTLHYVDPDSSRDDYYLVVDPDGNAAELADAAAWTADHECSALIHRRRGRCERGVEREMPSEQERC